MRGNMLKHLKQGVGSFLRLAVTFVVVLGILASSAISRGEVSYAVLHGFTFPPGPWGIIQGGDGAFYGTTEAGPGRGTVFRIAADGTGFTVLHSFTGTDGAVPGAGLIQGTGGVLYGTTTYGGTWDRGTVFRIAADGTGFTVLHSFAVAEGARPQASLLQGSDGALYGTTNEGGTYNLGTVFKIATDGTGFATIHSFTGTDGAFPQTSLLLGSDGALYGTTSGGGTWHGGTVFKLATNGTGFTTLYSFTETDKASPRAGVLQGSDGALYGTTKGSSIPYGGTVFKIATNGSSFTVLQTFTGSDGAGPDGGLFQANDGTFYGTTRAGGAWNRGTVFKIAADGTNFTSLYSFNGTEGNIPQAGLLRGTDGELYGTTAYGGSWDRGTVFKITAVGTGFTTLRSFNGSDGAYPLAGLIQGNDGALYGTTSEGGSSDRGTVFKIGADGTGFTILYSFDVTDGHYPQAGLLQRSDGTLYGTTAFGGPYFANGTVFKIATDGSGFAVLHSFGGTDAGVPQAGLLQGSDGALYGTTRVGGASQFGSVFKVAPDGTGFITLHSFSGTDGHYPQAGLLQGSDGALYGTTYEGGASDGGTVFKLTPDGTGFTTLHSFAGTDGTNPRAGLLQASDGSLYGTTSSIEASDGGTVFRVAPDGTGFTVLHSFTWTDGGYPVAGLLQSSDGALYGTTLSGGPSSGGVVFRLSQFFTLTVGAAGVGSGTVSPVAAGSSTTYNYDTPVTLTATPGPGSIFTGWSGDCTGAGDCTVSMTQARNVTATFSLQTFTLIVSGSGNGSGMVSPVAVGNSGTYNYGTSVSLTATPAAGSIFTGWSWEGCSGTGTCTVTMTQARSVLATFQLLTTVTVTTNPSGRQITVDGQTYPAPQTFDWVSGTTHTLGVPSPQSGSTGTRYVFGAWRNGGAQNQTVMTPAGATTYTAAFITQHVLGISVSPEAGGTVAATPPGDTAGLACIALLGVICPGYYESGTSVTLTAIPDAGYVFTGWSGDLTGPPNPGFLLMNGPKNVTAIFTSQLPTLALGVNAPIVHPGDTLTLTATVTPGATTTFADVYVALALPGGTLLFLQGDGSLTAEMRPIVSHWTVGSYTGSIFTHHFDGWEPAGSYLWYAAFTNPGQNPLLGTIGPIVMAPFSFTP